jgi:periplasmic divalent cation tolerance protein
MVDMTDQVLVYITVPVDQASGLARELVIAGLAACVNVVETVRSTYRWKGEVVTDQESLLFCKSTGDRVTELVAFVKQHHPYEVPGISVMPITGGNPDFLQWISQMTQR